MNHFIRGPWFQKLHLVLKKRSCSQSFSCCVFFSNNGSIWKTQKKKLLVGRMDLKHVYSISTIQILYEFMIKCKHFISKACCFGVICHHHVHVNSSLNTMLYLGQTSKSFKREPIPTINSPLWIEILWEVFMPNFINIKVPNTKMLGRRHKCFVDIFKLFQKRKNMIYSYESMINKNVFPTEH